MTDDYELLEEAISLLGTHRYEHHYAHTLGQEELPSLTKAMKLLIEIRNNERKREQDEHAIAFAKLHKNSADPFTRKMSREFLRKYALLQRWMRKNEQL